MLKTHVRPCLNSPISLSYIYSISKKWLSSHLIFILFYENSAVYSISITFISAVEQPRIPVHISKRVICVNCKRRFNYFGNDEGPHLCARCRNLIKQKNDKER